jgi:hypothetical protein
LAKVIFTMTNRHPMFLFFKFAMLPLLVSATLLTACKDETDDFTSGNFYPIDPTEQDPGTPGDTTVITTPDTCWKAPISVKHAADFNQLFTRFSGWTGGDATYSVPLPDGRILWLFGDSFIGTVNPNRTRPPGAFHRNAFVVQDGDDLTTLTGAASAYLVPADAGWWYWPGHGMAHGDTLQVVMFGFKSSGVGGMWDFDYASVDVVTFKLPDFTLLSIDRKVTDPPFNYGACLLEDGGFTYIYGMEKVGFQKFLHVARVSGHDLNGEWEYFTGTDWSADPAASARVFANVSDQFTVFKNNGRFYLLTQHHILGGEIYLFDSDQPAIGFDNKRTLYCTPQSNEGNLFTYNAFAHTQFSGNGGLLVSYNVNSSVFADLFKNADNYRPYFVRVKGWE